MAQQIPCPRLPANPKEADFKYFQRQLDNYFVIAKTKPDSKLSILLYSLGQDGLNIYDGLEEPKDDYENAILRLNKYFGGKTSVLLKRKLFYQCQQGTNETVTEFSCRLRRLSKDCDFGSSNVTMLRDIFVIGVLDNNLGERLLSEDSSTLTFESAVNKAEAFERARAERRNVHPVPQSTVNAVANHTVASSALNCYRCGSRQHKANFPSCPAVNSSCNYCKKLGHFSKVCRARKDLHTTSKTPFTASSRRRDTKNPVNAVSAYDDVAREEEPTDVFTCYDAASLRSTSWFHHGFIDDRPLKALVDTGASVNVMPKKLLPSDCEILPCSQELRSFGMYPIPVCGQFSGNVRFGNFSVRATFIVADVPNDFALLSPKLSIDLHLLDLTNQPLSTVATSNDLNTHTQCSLQYLITVRGKTIRVRLITILLSRIYESLYYTVRCITFTSGGDCAKRCGNCAEGS